MIPLSWYLLVAAALFCLGLYGVIARRNAVAILMAVELMLNAVNINLIAFWRYRTLADPSNPQSVGLAWAIFVLTVAAAEAAVGLALIISVYRNRNSVIAEDLDMLKKLSNWRLVIGNGCVSNGLEEAENKLLIAELVNW